MLNNTSLGMFDRSNRGWTSFFSGGRIMSGEGGAEEEQDRVLTSGWVSGWASTTAALVEEGKDGAGTNDDKPGISKTLN